MISSRLRRFTSTVLCTVDAKPVDGWDVILAATLSGAWQDLEAAAVRAAINEADPTRTEPTREQVDAELVSWRYSRHLVSAAEFKDWLNEHEIALTELKRELRCHLRPTREPTEDVAYAASDLEELVYTFGMCSGAFGEMAQRLKDRLVSGQHQAVLAPSVMRTDWSAILTPLVAAMDPPDVAARMATLQLLESEFSRFRSLVADPKALAACVDRHQREWEMLHLDILHFPTMGQAREARLLLDEGIEACEIERFATRRQLVSLMREDGSQALQDQLLIRDIDGLSPVWADGRSWCAARVIRRIRPAAADEAVESRATEKLMGHALRELRAGRVRDLVPL